MNRKIKRSGHAKNWLARMLDGYAWLTDNVWLLVFFLLTFMFLVFLISWHTEQAIGYVMETDHMYGMTYLILYTLGIVMLVHEAEHIWKYKWLKVPIGILSVCFIYYCFLDALWWLVETALRLPISVSSNGTLLLCVVSAVLVWLGYINTKRVCRTAYKINLGTNGKTFRIALISDIHLGAFIGVGHVQRIVAAINAVQPDLVIIAGDLIDDDNSVLSDPCELNRIACVFRQIRSKHGTVLTLGNHDPDADNPVFLSLLKKSHIVLLNNHTMELPFVNVVGRSDPTRNYRESMDKLIADLNRSKPTIVADHNPRYIDEGAAKNIDLILSGHTHAGQFFPATIATRIAVGKQSFYGHHKIGRTHTIVTSGAGFFNLPVRLGTGNEIVDLVIGL